MRFSLFALALFLLSFPVQADSVVQFNLNTTVNGKNYVQIQLYDAAAPITVTNFLRYVNNGIYNGTIIHREAVDFVTQGGGFYPVYNDQNIVSAINPISTYAPIQNEFSPTRSNLRGTIAMAKLGGNPNSATSQWFVNQANNNGYPAYLDQQNGGFTVFGKVLYDGMDVFDYIDSLPIYNLNSYYYPQDVVNGPFNSVPILPGTKLVTITSAVVLAQPAVWTWKGGTNGGTTQWGQVANWQTAAGVPDAKGMKVKFDSSALTNTVDMATVGRTIGTLTMTSPTTISSTGGHALTFDNNGAASSLAVAGNQVISAPVVLKNGLGIGGGGNLTLSGGVTGNYFVSIDKGTVTAKSLNVQSVSLTPGTVLNISPIGSPLSDEAPSAVPEPTSGLLVLLAGALLFLFRRK